MVWDHRTREGLLPVGSGAGDLAVPSTVRRRIDAVLPDILWEGFVRRLPQPVCLRGARGRYLMLNQGYEDLLKALGVPGARSDCEVFPEFLVAAFAADDQLCVSQQRPLTSQNWLCGPSMATRALTTRIPLESGVLLLIEDLGTESDRAAHADGAGSARALLGALPEIARLREQRELQARLERTQRLESVGLLAGGLAHDLNNLLAGVMGYAELSLRTLQGESGVQTSVDCLIQLKEAVLQAAGLTKQMLTYSGRGRSERALVDLGEIVTQTCSLVRSAFGGNLCLECAVEEELPAVRADTAEIRQLVINLLTNAAEAVQGVPERRVQVRASWSRSREASSGSPPRHSSGEGEGWVILEVSDTGTGIPREALDRVFEPFYSTKGDDRGLGLSAVAGIVQRLGGRMGVESEPGKGTTMRIELAAQYHTWRAAPESSVRSRPLRGRGELLIVDDQSTVRSAVARLLRQHGFVVHEVDSGERALEFLRSAAESLCAVLLDLTLPGLCGSELLLLLRQTAPTLPVLVWSGFEEHEVRAHVDDGLRFSFIQKPFSIDVLFSELGLLLEDAHLAP